MPGRFEWLVVACVGMGLFALGRLAIERRPDEVFREHFLFQDEGFNLYLAQQLLAGKQLYGEVASQYGPIPAYLTTAVAGTFGNTMAVYVTACQVLHLLALLLAYAALRRAVSRTTAGLVALLCLVPIMLFPLALAGGYIWNVYSMLERCCLAGLALAWAPPQTRTARQAVLLGSILGLMQGVKFGGAFFAGAALLTLDLLALRLGEPVPLRKSWRAVFAPGVVFLVWQATWTAAAVLTLPPAVAADVLWPSYHLVTYAKARGSALPEWHGWSEFVQNQFTATFGLALGLAGLAVVLWRARTRSGDSAGLRPLLLLFFFLFACLGYLRHELLTYDHLWTAAGSSAWLLDRVGWRTRGLLCLCWLPGATVMLAHVNSVPYGTVRFELPNGEAVYLPPPLSAALQRLTEELPREAQSRKANATPRALVIRVGAGFHVFYGAEPPLRNVWVYPGMFRPYDDEELAAKLDEVTAVVLIGADGPVGEPERWGADYFSPRTCALLRQRVGRPIDLGSNWWLVPLRPRSEKTSG